MEECHKLLTDSVNDPILRHNVSKPLPLGGPPGQVTIQSDFLFNKDLEYLRYGSKGSRPALSISKIKAAYYPNAELEQMTRHLVIRQRIEDFQLGIESYQTQLNLTKPQWDATGSEYKHDYTIIDSPRAVMFWDRYGVQMMMRFNKIHKFSNGTLQQIDGVLDYRVKEFRINRMNPGLNTRFWTRKDVDRSKAFMFAIQRRLKTRWIFCNLESFVDGRVREGNYRLLKQVLRKDKKEKSKNKERVPTQMELELEHTQQGSSYEVSVAVCSSLRSLKPKLTIESRAKRSSKIISLGHYSIMLASSHTMKSKTDMKSPTHYPCEVSLLKKAKAQITRWDKGFNDQLTQQVSTLQTQVTSEEWVKAAFEEFKKYKDDRVEKHCSKMDARLDALSIDFDEELYPHMLTSIASCRWVIGHGLRLAVMKCAELIELRQAFANVMSAGIAKGMSEGTPKAERSKVSNNRLAGGFKGCPNGEEMLLEEAIATDVSFAEKKKRCRVVCRTHGVSSAHHARSNGVPVSVPTIAPQGLAILLADAATQTETSEDDASPRLLRSKSLPPVYDLDWL
uniref:Uncharacterized protein n=1 Tax=Tanacetum cinerariifolium TaxID=118510 RepID=A0A6L2M7X2_TANCI|nr:hypothetical protein [Tanacetum cinerariifolium]